MSEPYYTDDAVTLWHSDCLDVLREAAYLPLIVARLSKPIQIDLFGGAA